MKKVLVPLVFMTFSILVMDSDAHQQVKVLEVTYTSSDERQSDDNLWIDCLSLLLKLYTKRAHRYALNNDFDAALADINTALDIYYDSVDSPFNIDPDVLAPLFVQRGQIYLLLYEWDNVLDDYNTALQIDPDYADPYYYRGVLYYSVRFERENAIPDFERYLELAPDGLLADKAAQYLTDIRAELEALER